MGVSSTAVAWANIFCHYAYISLISVPVFSTLKDQSMPCQVFFHSLDFHLYSILFLQNHPVQLQTIQIVPSPPPWCSGSQPYFPGEASIVPLFEAVLGSKNYFQFCGFWDDWGHCRHPKRKRRVLEVWLDGNAIGVPLLSHLLVCFKMLLFHFKRLWINCSLVWVEVLHFPRRLWDLGWSFLLSAWWYCWLTELRIASLLFESGVVPINAMSCTAEQIESN